jgi:hypothetical protein
MSSQRVAVSSAEIEFADGSLSLPIAQQAPHPPPVAVNEGANVVPTQSEWAAGFEIGFNDPEGLRGALSGMTRFGPEAERPL